MNKDNSGILDDILASIEEESASAIEKIAEENENAETKPNAFGLASLDKEASVKEVSTDGKTELVDQLHKITESLLNKEASESELDRDMLSKIAEDTISDIQDMEASARELGKIAAESFKQHLGE